MNNFHPLVSIIIPVYNGSNYLQSAIDSSLAQDYDNFEIIVVNDGSTDNTNEIAKSYGDKIKYFSKENGGVSTALNLAIKNALGEYISWLSHDDYYLPNKISRQIEELGKLKNREKIIPYSNAKLLNLINKTESYYIQDKKEVVLSRYDSIKSLFLWHIHGCSLLIPKQAFYEVSFFNAKLRTTQDYDLWFRFVNAGYLLYYIPEVLMVTRWHLQQKGNNRTPNEVKEDDYLWKFTKRLFRKDIKKAPRNERHLFNMHDKKNHLFRKIILKIIPKKIKLFLKKHFVR